MENEEQWLGGSSPAGAAGEFEDWPQDAVPGDSGAVPQVEQWPTSDDFSSDLEDSAASGTEGWSAQAASMENGDQRLGGSSPAGAAGEFEVCPQDAVPGDSGAVPQVEQWPTSDDFSSHSASSSAKRLRSATGDRSAILAAPAPTEPGPLDFGKAWRYLTDPAEMCDGHRPDFLLAAGQTLHDHRGKVFKEMHFQSGGAKRRNRTDQWERKSGRRGHTDTLIEGTGAVVRRSYGYLKMINEHGEVDKTSYHEYEILSPDDARSIDPQYLKYRLYHLPAARHDPSRERQPVLPNERVQSGLLRLQLASDSEAPDRWMQFEDSSHHVMGSIEQNERGFATFITPAGDFAEWHRRVESEEPMEEGDVVGFVSPVLGDDSNDGRQQITRRTKGVSALGVITHRAAVAGSAPNANQRHLFETVAYTGRVPIKIRGPVKAGMMVGPSGCEDGTAIMLSACSSGPAVGRAEHSTDEFEQKGDSGLEIELQNKPEPAAQGDWRSVDCVVVNPSQSTRARFQWPLQCTIALLALLGCVCTYITMRSTHRTVHCPAEQIDMLTWHESTLECNGCGPSRSTRLRIPRTAVSAHPRRIECPGDAYVGSVNRTCTISGWGPLQGDCRRKRCPSSSFNLDPGASQSTLIA
eukprot:COSAG02_NODE_1223_length_13799_cov_11.479270_10_plen_636_part_00